MSKEPTTRAELYRVLKNVIEKGVRFENDTITNPAVEYPVNNEKADLVVFSNKYVPGTPYLAGSEKAFFVIETKARFKYPSNPLGKATEQVLNYAKKLQCRFFAVYDGWNFLLFENIRPHLIKLSNFHRMDESTGKNLLVGLLEYSKKGRDEAKNLHLLPKVADGWSFWVTILPTIAKSLAPATTPERAEAWKVLKEAWLPIIKRDGEW